MLQVCAMRVPVYNSETSRCFGFDSSKTLVRSILKNNTMFLIGRGFRITLRAHYDIM